MFFFIFDFFINVWSFSPERLLFVTQFLIGLLLAGAIAWVAYRRGSLSRSGALGAIFIGTVIFGMGGWAWGVLLVVFFVSSSALSHYKEQRKAALAEKFSKGHRRDIWQVLANGSVGALCVLGFALWPGSLWWAAYAGALATVNADTWATELGVLAKTAPRLIITGQPVEVGTSGGVTPAGMGAALAGAALIGLTAALFDFVAGQSLSSSFLLSLIAIVSGLAGSLVDSLLGATVQAIYFCERCGKETERHPLHSCGQPTRFLRGLRRLDNDWVNFLSSIAGTALAAGLWWIVAPV